MVIQGRGKAFPPYKNDGNIKMMHFCNPNDILPSMWKKNSLNYKTKWRCEMSVRNKEWHGLSSFFPWSSTRELGFGMKLSSPLSTELTKHSIFPGHMQCLFNWSASLRGECVLHLGEVHNWGDPALPWRFHWSQQAQHRSRRSLPGTRLMLRSDIAFVPGKKQKCIKKHHKNSDQHLPLGSRGVLIKNLLLV